MNQIFKIANKITVITQEEVTQHNVDFLAESEAHGATVIQAVDFITVDNLT